MNLRKILIFLLSALTIVIIFSWMISLNAPKRDIVYLDPPYEFSPLPSVSTSVIDPLAPIDILREGDTEYIIDYGLRRILVYQKGEFDKVLLNNNLINTEEGEYYVGKPRAFSRVGDKIYLSTTERKVFIVDTEDNEFAIVDDIVPAEYIANNRESDTLYYTDFGKVLYKREEYESELYVESIFLNKVLMDMVVHDNMLYALSKPDNEVIIINTNFSELDIKTFFKLEDGENIVGFDISGDIFYVFSYDCSQRKNKLYLLDESAEGKEVLVDLKVLHGKVRGGKDIKIIDTEINEIITINKKGEIVDTWKTDKLTDHFDMFDPRAVMPYSDGYLVSNDETNELYYLECDRGCNIVKKIDIYRPRQISYVNDGFCVGMFHGGVKCFDNEFNEIMHLMNYKNKLLAQSRGIIQLGEDVYIAETESGCVYKFSNEFTAVDEVCWPGKPRSLLQIDDMLGAISSEDMALYIIDPDEMELAETIYFEGEILRDVCYKDGNLFVVFMRSHTERIELVEKEGTYKLRDKKLLFKTEGARSCYVQDNVLYVADQNAHKIIVYDLDQGKLLDELTTGQIKDVDFSI